MSAARCAIGGWNGGARIKAVRVLHATGSATRKRADGSPVSPPRVAGRGRLAGRQAFGGGRYWPDHQSRHRAPADRRWLVFGLGIALGAAPRWRAGLPTTFRYEDLGLPTLEDCPEMDIAFIASEATPADPGELGAVVAPPAVANALFSATGLRLRRLPLLSSGL
jgi:hypothetical protein